jgi:hypothetical protein
MLDYAPDGMAGRAALYGQDWAISWEQADSAANSLLSNLMTARKTNAGSRAKPRNAAPAFQPEVMSGFCAV